MSASYPQTEPKEPPPRRSRAGQRRRVGPFSRAGALALMDGRSTEARFLRGKRKSLLEHLGGSASATQAALIERASMLSLHLALLDEKTLVAGCISERDGRQYLAWSASLIRCLTALGLQAPATPAEPLSEWWARQRQGDAA